MSAEDANPKNPVELLAEARAIHLAMRHGALSYDEAKRRVASVLEGLNRIYAERAKKYSVKHRPIRFQDLGRKF
jgi:hypothetical protein